MITLMMRSHSDVVLLGHVLMFDIRSLMSSTMYNVLKHTIREAEKQIVYVCLLFLRTGKINTLIN